MAVNKVVYGGSTLIDITDTTATAQDVAEGKTFYAANGVRTTGTNSGGSASTKAFQHYDGYDYISATSYTATEVTLTVQKTGVYNIYWMGWRNTTSGTSGSRIYKNGSAIGTAHTTFEGNYGQRPRETNISLSQGDVLVVRARARSTSYRMYVANLIIEEV